MNTGHKSLPFPWHAQAAKFIKRKGIPDLSGSKLMIASDTRYKKDDGIIIDSILCTNERNFSNWLSRNTAIRAHNTVPEKGLDYTELRYNSTQWAAVAPSLKSASMLDGLAIVIRYHRSLMDYTTQVVAELQAKGISTTRHKWKPEQFVRIVGMSGMVATVIGTLSVADQDVHWISDHDYPLENHNMREDVLDLIAKATHQCVPHPLGKASFSTPQLVDPREKQIAKDLIAIADLFAGGVGDTILGSSYVADNFHLWEPDETNSRKMMAGVIGNWFWLDEFNPLKRIALDVEYVPTPNGIGKITMSWIVSDPKLVDIYNEGAN